MATLAALTACEKHSGPNVPPSPQQRGEPASLGGEKPEGHDPQPVVSQLVGHVPPGAQSGTEQMGVGTLVETAPVQLVAPVFAS
jgi:hypothetical protein